MYRQSIKLHRKSNTRVSPAAAVRLDHRGVRPVPIGIGTLMQMRGVCEGHIWTIFFISSVQTTAAADTDL